MTPAPAVARKSRIASLRLATRLARRETFRRPGRTLLVALLVAVPVAGMVVADVWIRTEKQTPTQRWQGDWGNADLYFNEQSPEVNQEPGVPSLLSLLPEGSRALSYRVDYRIVRTSDGSRSSTGVSELPMTDPIAAPIVQIMRGRAPSEAGEVFLTRPVANDLNADLGDVLELERPVQTQWRVVGIGELRQWWGSDMVVLAPGTPTRWESKVTGLATYVLVDLPANVSTAQLEALTTHPAGVQLAPWLPATSMSNEGANPAGALAWSWVIGAVVLTVAGIVIAAAFATGARRQLTTLGQLAANGAPPPALRRVLFLQGTWTGALGVILGLVLAVATLVGIAPHVDEFFKRDVGLYRVRLTDLIPILVLGVVAATVAAMIPARTTARISILSALAGRRPLSAIPRWMTVTGVLIAGSGLALLGLAVLGGNGSTAGGTVWTLTATIGGIAVLLGACTIAPGYVSVLGTLAARLVGSSRLAARSLSRQRTRTAAVVSAVCATSALAIAASAFLLTANTRYDDEPGLIRDDEVHLWATNQPAVPSEDFQASYPLLAEVPKDFVDDTRSAIPGAKTHELEVALPAGGMTYAAWELSEFIPESANGNENSWNPLDNSSYPGIAVIADGKFLDLYNLPGAARKALAKDGAIAFASLPGTGSISLRPIQTPEGGIAPPPGFAEIPPFPITIFDADYLDDGYLPSVLLTRDRAQSLGLEVSNGPIVVRAPYPITEEQRTALQVLQEDRYDLERDETKAIGTQFGITTTRMDLPYDQFRINTLLLEALLSAAALVLSLFVVAAGLALAAAETRDERDVLVVVGAPPKTMRRTSGYKALFLTFLGTALAVPVGFLPVAVFTAVNDSDLPLLFPWRAVLLLLLVTPLVAGAITTIVSGLALRVRPVRVSTMAFD